MVDLPAVSRTNEENMNGVTALAQSRNIPSSSEIHHSSGSKVQEANHRIRIMIILGLALEVAFLTALAACEFSSIFRFQNWP
jgi:hypothetical protein